MMLADDEAAALTAALHLAGVTTLRSPYLETGRQ